MIKIHGNSLDGITLGQTFAEIIEKAFQGERYYFEFDKKVKRSAEAPLITISVRDVQSFELNGERIEYEGIYQWLDENDALVEVCGDSIHYTIPKYNLELLVDVDNTGFQEVLLYADSEKGCREDDLLTFHDFISMKEVEINLQDVDFTPFKSLANFEFGSSVERLSNFYRHTLMVNSPQGKAITWVDNVCFKFTDGKMSQIYFDRNERRPMSIKLDGKDIMEKGTIDHLLENEEYLEKGSIYVFTRLGLAVTKSLDEYYFFDHVLLPLWENDKRPVTSF